MVDSTTTLNAAPLWDEIQFTEPDEWGNRIFPHTHCMSNENHSYHKSDDFNVYSWDLETMSSKLCLTPWFNQSFSFKKLLWEFTTNFSTVYVHRGTFSLYKDHLGFKPRRKSFLFIILRTVLTAVYLPPLDDHFKSINQITAWSASVNIFAYMFIHRHFKSTKIIPGSNRLQGTFPCLLIFLLLIITHNLSKQDTGYQHQGVIV